MKKIKVLVADDSIIYRSQIKQALDLIPLVEEVITVANGKLALNKLAQHSIDLIILDLEMPELDGLQTLKELKRLNYQSKVIMFSGATKRAAEMTMEALSLGASHFISKPSGEHEEVTLNPTEKIKGALEPNINALFKAENKSFFEPPKNVATYPNIIWDLLSPQAVVIGSSTGGPTLLEQIFSQLRGSLNCPIFIAQHMPPVFTAALAERLTRLSGFSVTEAKDGMIAEKDKVYIAPGDFHMVLKGSPNRVEIVLNQDEKIHSVRPAVDPLFFSAASIFKNRCLGFVLTGMGYDGRDGAVEIKKNAGAVVIQAEATCVVYGMPGAVASMKAYDKIATPDQIVQILKEKVVAADGFHTSTNLKVGG